LLTKVSDKLKAPKMRFLAPDGKSELRLSLAKKTGKNPGYVYVTIRGEYIDKIAPNGATYIKDATLLDTLTNIGNDPAKAAKEYGAFAGRCSFCGLELTDAGSIEVGYGGTCAANYGLPHKYLGTPEVKNTRFALAVTALAQLRNAVEPRGPMKIRWCNVDFRVREAVIDGITYVATWYPGMRATDRRKESRGSGTRSYWTVRTSDKSDEQYDRDGEDWYESSWRNVQTSVKRVAEQRRHATASATSEQQQEQGR
jgi:hypothetical protein